MLFGLNSFGEGLDLPGEACTTVVITQVPFAVPTDPQTMTFGPRFSPDGRWIVYSREKGGNTDLWQMDVATGAERPLTETAAIETSPFFSPDGRQIVFESDQSGSQQIYVMPADGSAEPARMVSAATPRA